ncbi:hypothetical protein SBD_6251 [Streptomyces bottropensis ATCC 25435]|uniref:Uncharacterized protein n=1 Tax=Streptomyces bottropensis ATCC 25435 TaxID=1054862 RepID=M3ERP9_9ACTN|nr:hypothetical protein SBD_6251 [Streptomyces bottropensis ATCC 25435]
MFRIPVRAAVGSVPYPSGAVVRALRGPALGAAGRLRARSTQETHHVPMSTLPRARRREGVTRGHGRCRRRNGGESACCRFDHV